MNESAAAASGYAAQIVSASHDPWRNYVLNVLPVPGPNSKGQWAPQALMNSPGSELRLVLTLQQSHGTFPLSSSHAYFTQYLLKPKVNSPCKSAAVETAGLEQRRHAGNHHPAVWFSV